MDPAIVSRGMSKAIVASCESTDTLPITVLPVPTAETMALYWQDAGRMVAVGFRTARERQFQGGNGDDRKDGCTLGD
jgi:hypothetical protein